jgi:hypothetical protein
VLRNQEEARASWSSYWRPAARVAAAGDGGVTWQGGEKPAGVGRAAGGRAGGPGGVGRAVRGSWQLGRSSATGGGRRSRTTERGERGRRQGLVHNFSKVQGFHCKVRFSFKLYPK